MLRRNFFKVCGVALATLVAVYLLGKPRQAGMTIDTRSGFAVWNVVLNDAEIAALASGAPPTMVRPNELRTWVKSYNAKYNRAVKPLRRT